MVNLESFTSRQQRKMFIITHKLAWLEKQHAELAENRTIPDQVKFR